ncbi:hypothetical protein F5876DRAFT_72408 [Lentinula aff. lateritia]|uniref:Uncharacterized protein n=1 Tax=Lentinula aff. lateritia TaxID=2804960 RepID=A0ACC1UDZ5_9AGAR|nr:hypothetical protein F5876DRAFT_72408 [Lentinula aff. lateritia]
MFFKLRRKESPWEVAERKLVDPVLMYEEEELDLDVVNPTDICGTYVFDVKKHDQSEADLRNAVVIARQQLLQEIATKGLNVLLTESWNLTVYRQGKRRRIEVRYSGRPAHACGKLPLIHPPPFMELLRD